MDSVFLMVKRFSCRKWILLFTLTRTAMLSKSCAEHMELFVAVDDLLYALELKEAGKTPAGFEKELKLGVELFGELERALKASISPEGYVPPALAPLIVELLRESQLSPTELAGALKSAAAHILDGNLSPHDKHTLYTLLRATRKVATRSADELLHS